MIVFLLILNLISLSSDSISTGEGKFKILPASRVYLEGTTNVNKFKCDCGNNFESSSYHLRNIEGNKMEFSNTLLSLTIEFFDCKNRKMDRDLQKALKADQFPTVRIQLENITLAKGHLTGIETGNWTLANALVNISLAGVTRQHLIPVKAKKGVHHQFHFTGHQTMNMTDFNVTPPDALFGMIKANDPITFYFDLVLELEQHPGLLQ
ncbi:MAG: YceI family protein [Saprospiraceae bacterium]|nr:YceI family protein [Saprospiraceae bacterium]